MFAGKNSRNAPGRRGVRGKKGGGGEDRTIRSPESDSASSSIGLLKVPSCEQRREIARGHNARAFMMGECKQTGLVACHQIIGLAAFAHGQQKIVGGVGGAFHARQRTYI